MNIINEPSVKSLYIEMLFNGNRLSSGTAFIVLSKKGPLLITNRHNVTGRSQIDGSPLHESCGVPNEIRIFHHKKDNFGVWILKIQDLYWDKDNMGKSLWFEHPQYKEKADFVALKLTELDNIVCYPYDISVPQMKLKLCPTECISVIGFPFGLSASANIDQYFPIWVNGFLASEPTINYNNLPLQLIDCRSREGQSGSPVIAFRNGLIQYENNNMASNSNWEEFIGIYSGRINEKSDIGLVWKVSAIRELIQYVENN